MCAAHFVKSTGMSFKNLLIEEAAGFIYGSIPVIEKIWVSFEMSSHVNYLPLDVNKLVHVYKFVSFDQTCGIDECCHLLDNLLNNF